MYYKPNEDVWCVCPGNIDAIKKGKQNTLDQVVAHIFLKDTLDQGLSLCLPNVSCYLNNDDESPVNDIKAELAKVRVEYAVSNRDDKLLAQCHCGQVQLYIDRPDDG